MKKQTLLFINILLALGGSVVLFWLFGWWSMLPIVICGAWGAAGAIAEPQASHDPNQSPLDVYLSKQRKDSK
jgi:fatty acid desaturase